jgi:hypothetical protein
MRVPQVHETAVERNETLRMHFRMHMAELCTADQLILTKSAKGGRTTSRRYGYSLCNTYSGVSVGKTILDLTRHDVRRIC